MRFYVAIEVHSITPNIIFARALLAKLEELDFLITLESIAESLAAVSSKDHKDWGRPGSSTYGCGSIHCE
jgi:alanine racemase